MNIDIFRDIPYKKRTKCAVCRKKLDVPIIEMSSLPLTDIYIRRSVKERVGFVDQGLLLCQNCGHAQLLHVIEPRLLYGQTYSFRTSKSTWGATKGNDFYVSYIEKVTKGRNVNTIIEIGCNDLYLLNSLRSKAERLVGVDPVLKGKEKELSDNKITAIGDFFENIDMRQYIQSDNVLILSSQLLEHIDDPRALIENLIEIANDKTLFIFQFPGFDSLVNDYRFDQIYHHHYHYFSLYSFMYLLNEIDCELVSHDINPHYWGSLLVAFKKRLKKKTHHFEQTEKFSNERVLKSYDLFKRRMEDVNKYIESFKDERLYGYGAGLQLPVLGYHLNNDFSSFKCIIDDDKKKDGSFYINLPVQIKSLNSVGTIEDAIILITAINFSRGILRKIIPLNPKRIVLPFNNI